MFIEEKQTVKLIDQLKNHEIMEGRAYRVAQATVNCNSEDEIIELLPLMALNAGDSDGWTPLYWALLSGCKDAVKRILDIPGINYQVKTHDGETLAHAAVKSLNDGIVALLSDVPSIDWNVGDSDGMTPLFWALTLGTKML